MTPPQASTLPAAGVTETTPRTKAKLGSLRALWPFVRRHMGLFVSWLVALAVASAATLSLPASRGGQLIASAMPSGRWIHAMRGSIRAMTNQRDSGCCACACRCVCSAFNASLWRVLDGRSWPAACAKSM